MDAAVVASMARKLAGRMEGVRVPSWTVLHVWLGFGGGDRGKGEGKRKGEYITDSRSGEPAWPDGDEDARPLGVARQFLGHEAVEEGGADHEADEEACALDGDGRSGDGDGVDVGELAGAGGGPDEVGTEGGCQEEWVGREDPDGGHGVDWEDSGRVLAQGLLPLGKR